MGLNLYVKTAESKRLPLSYELLGPPVRGSAGAVGIPESSAGTSAMR
jgi:hypothetical protein